VVFHLAARTQSEHGPEDVEPLIEANVAFPAQLVEAMLRAGARLLVSAETFWQSDASGAYSPVCLYAATKQAFRDILEYYVEAEGLSALSLVLYDVYGPADPRAKLLNALAKAALTGQPLSVTPGDQTVELVHVHDVARAFAIAGNLLDSGQGDGTRTYGVFGCKPRTLKEIVAIFADVARVPVPVNWGARPYRPREVMRPYIGYPTLPGCRSRPA
jgi:nucleoside-diphosphate-sugar epimerase